jgi:hypothetical protein
MQLRPERAGRNATASALEETAESHVQITKVHPKHNRASHNSHRNQCGDQRLLDRAGTTLVLH